MDSGSAEQKLIEWMNQYLMRSSTSMGERICYPRVVHSYRRAEKEIDDTLCRIFLSDANKPYRPFASQFGTLQPGDKDLTQSNDRKLQDRHFIMTE